MPFGLTNAPAYFMNLMNKIFMDELDKHVIVFIDDILVYSKTIEEHEEHLRKVPEKLRSHRLKNFIPGAYHHGEGVTVDHRKGRGVMEWPQPTNVSEVRELHWIGGILPPFHWGLCENCQAHDGAPEKGCPYSLDIHRDFVIYRDASRQGVPKTGVTGKIVMEEAHNSAYSIHPGSTKMYLDLKTDCGWKGMKADIARYVARCDVCRE
ncbi:hypothetical protein U9M48_011111 [Paspalum notatum var. saurae]|uniref:Reverse transcriptase domain-containing protein n=1 Tax=Paspalum notatum var. saurae TaxID=547442 RepID=A0AAQ3SUR2_PASNO